MTPIEQLTAGLAQLHPAAQALAVVGLVLVLLAGILLAALVWRSL